MKFNKKILLVSFLLIFLSIGTVCASEEVSAIDANNSVESTLNSVDADMSNSNNVLATNSTIGNDDSNKTVSNISVGDESSSKTNTSMFSIGDNKKYYKNSTHYVVKLIDADNESVSNQTIYFKILNKTYSRVTDSDGLAIFKINLNPGVYLINTNYYTSNSSIYGPSSLSENFTVLANVETSDVSMYYKNGTRFIVKIFGDNPSQILSDVAVNFTLGGKTYSKVTNENGTTSLAINLYPGTYNITTNANGLSVKNTIKVLAPIVTKNTILYYKNGTRFTATVLNNNSSGVLPNAPVKFTIAGKTYSKTTNENGTTSLALNLNPGYYTMTTSANGFSVNNTVVVLSTIRSSDVSLYYKNGTRFKVKVFDKKPSQVLANATVKFTIAGKTYTKTTNENGTTSLALNLKPGVYKISTTSNGLTVKNTVTVLSPINVSDVSTTYKNSFKYNVKVVDNGKALSGKKVTVVFNKKNYVGTTDKNGEVNITINPGNLKPGDYNIITNYKDAKGTYKETKKVTINKGRLSLALVSDTVKLTYNKKYRTYIGKLKIKATYNNKAVSGETIIASFNFGKLWYKSDIKTNSKGIAYWTLDSKFKGKNGTLFTVYNSTYYSSSILYTTVTVKK